MSKFNMLEEPFQPKTNEKFLEHLIDNDPVECPCCGKVYNRLYQRKIYKGMVQALRLLYKRNKDASPNNFGDFTKLEHFGLVTRTDDGYWFVTPYGEKFIKGSVPVPKYVFLRNNVPEGYSEEEIFVHEII